MQQIEHLTIAEAAEALKVSSKTIRAAVKSGSLRSMRLSRRTIRIPAAALATYSTAEEGVE